MAAKKEPKRIPARPETAMLEAGKVQTDYWDTKVKGLHLRVSGKARTWQFRYRTADNRQPRYTIGRCPPLGLRDARDAANELILQISRGADPSADRRRARHAPVAVRTFDDLADRYEAACASGEWTPKGKRKRDRVLSEEKRMLASNVRPTLGEIPLAEIKRADIKALLKDLKKPTKARPVPLGAQTNRTHAVIRQVFAFGIAEDLVESNPAVGFAQVVQESPRERIWTDAELSSLWGALCDPSTALGENGRPVAVTEGLRLAVRLAIMLGQRRSEIIGMERAELDLQAGTWLLPAARTKSGRPHMVPLGAEAVTLINRAIELADRDREKPSAYVFPTTRREDRPVRPDSLSQAVRRLAEALNIEGAHVHDIRRTVATNLTSERCGVSPFVRSMILGHTDAGGGAMVSTRVYDRNSYLKEKREGLERWTALLMEIVGSTQSDAEEVAV